MSLRIGCIADDFTGATDVANALVLAGMRVVQTIGVPGDDLAAGARVPSDVDVVVVALKSRTIPAGTAVQQSLEAMAWLRRAGAEQIYFKYCSTFDSTRSGNIGCVTEALLDALGSKATVLAPAYPANGRTVYQGHLFVGDRLVSESGMENHPLTPMTDPDLVRVLRAQCRGDVALMEHAVVTQGPEAMKHRLVELQTSGARLIIVDAVDDQALDDLAEATAGLPLVTGGARLAQGLAKNWGFEQAAEAARLPPAEGAAAIVAGSVSAATREQVDAAVAHGMPAFCVEPLRLAAEFEAVIAEGLALASLHLGRSPVLIYSTADPEAVVDVQSRLGATDAQELIEAGLARVAQGLVELGVRSLIVAGGDTSGAVVQSLGIQQLQIGPQIAPGVPWCATTLADGSTMHIALKSGNFGARDFFMSAFAKPPRTS